MGKIKIRILPHYAPKMCQKSQNTAQLILSDLGLFDGVLRSKSGFGPDPHWFLFETKHFKFTLNTSTAALLV